MWAKLEALAEGARLASKELWGKGKKAAKKPAAKKAAPKKRAVEDDKAQTRGLTGTEFRTAYGSHEASDELFGTVPVKITADVNWTFR